MRAWSALLLVLVVLGLVGLVGCSESRRTGGGGGGGGDQDAGSEIESDAATDAEVTDPEECGEYVFSADPPEPQEDCGWQSCPYKPPDYKWRPCPETIRSSIGALRCVKGDEIVACVTFSQCVAVAAIDSEDFGEDVACVRLE